MCDSTAASSVQCVRLLCYALWQRLLLRGKVENVFQCGDKITPAFWCAVVLLLA